jgi:CDP-glucose 4,6-dehydratase
VELGQGAVESLVEGKAPLLPDAAFWRDKRVLLTGHTGFKGGWCALWLAHLGARVTGVALPPAGPKSLYELARLDRDIDSRIADVRDARGVRALLDECRPQIVIHMAAQALVRASYLEPLETYGTNVMGTVNVADAARHCRSVRALVMVTSDKCYENDARDRPYGEGDALGGHDPYSSSKACAEIAIAAWRRSYFTGSGAPGLASARAGNVIGGGDWAVDRLLPDCIRAFAAGRPVVLRHPAAIRPWQHVLEPLRGYLLLAQRLCDAPERFAEAWNFGPAQEDARSVLDVATMAAGLWGSGARCEVTAEPQPHEATQLRLDTAKAATRLGWRPLVDLSRALGWTVEWYRRVDRGEDARPVTLAQIEAFERLFKR